MISLGLLILCFLPLSFGRPALLHAQQPHVASHSRELAVGLINEVPTMPITFSLHPNNKTGLISTLMDISNQAGANYGQHLSKSEVRLRRVTKD